MVLFGGSIIAGGDILAEAIQNEVAKKNIIVGGAGHTTETLRNVAGATDYFREFRLFYFVTRKIERCGCLYGKEIRLKQTSI